MSLRRLFIIIFDTINLLFTVGVTAAWFEAKSHNMLIQYPLLLLMGWLWLIIIVSVLKGKFMKRSDQ